MTPAEIRAVQRLRKNRGFISLRGKFARLADLAEIEPHLLTAEQVDAAIAGKTVEKEKK